jgi:hypothetical protein
VIHSSLFWVLFFIVGGLVWILPTLIALLRRVDSMGFVVMVNVFCLIMPLPGWFAAMYAAFRMPKRLPPRPVHRQIR